jgi:cytidylate kinase
MNDSFNEALKKLIENRYVVISGEPGIGKTTLARVLVMHLLSEKYADQSNTTSYEEFYYTNCNIEDLVHVFQKGKRQVFFYDDFLGKVTLEEGEKNFDSRIVAFIRACRHDNDKLFILATREYILQQGLVRYSRFNEGKGIEMSKCVVDMGKYTRFVKAQILYNHLVANEIPQPYVNAILHDKNYMKIIDHRNFSPRIIETFLTNGTHEQCQPEEYFGKIKGFFDYPDSVWLDAFERLSDIQKEALLVLTTMGTPMMYDLWKEAYAYFFKRVHKESNYLNDADWNNAVKVLQNNFIRVGKDISGMYVDFHNPGVFDVLTRYISANESIKYLLLENAYFIEQAFGALREDGRNNSHTTLTPKLIGYFYQVFERLWDDYRSCRTSLYSSYGNKHYHKSPLSRAEVLLRLQKDGELHNARPDYVEQKMTQHVLADHNADFYSQMELLGKADLSKTSLDLDALFNTYPQRLYIAEECLDFVESIEYVFPNHADYLETEEFCAIAAECLKHELEITQDSDLDDLVVKAEKLCESIPELENKPVISEIKNKAKEYSDYIDAQAEAYQDDPDFWRNEYVGTESWKIDNLFATIKE